MSMKKVTVFYETTESCGLGLARYLMQNFITQKPIGQWMKFSGLMCLGMKNFCETFCCKKT